MTYWCTTHPAGRRLVDDYPHGAPGLELPLPERVRYQAEGGSLGQPTVEPLQASRDRVSLGPESSRMAVQDDSSSKEPRQHIDGEGGDNRWIRNHDDPWPAPNHIAGGQDRREDIPDQH